MYVGCFVVPFIVIITLYCCHKHGVLKIPPKPTWQHNRWSLEPQGFYGPRTQAEQHTFFKGSLCHSLKRTIKGSTERTINREQNPCAWDRFETHEDHMENYFQTWETWWTPFESKTIIWKKINLGLKRMYACSHANRVLGGNLWKGHTSSCSLSQQHHETNCPYNPLQLWHYEEIF